MYIVFYSTSDVFKVEEILNDKSINCKVVPTPVSDKAYCGVCIWTDNTSVHSIISEIEHEIIE